MKSIVNVAIALSFVVMISCRQAKREPGPVIVRQAESNEEKTRNQSKDADELEDLQTLNLYKFMASEQMKGKAITAPVKNLSDSLKIRHAEMNSELQALAKRKGIELPDDLSREQKRKYDRMMEKDGIIFCKEYVRQMRDQHEEALSIYEDLARNAEDAEIKVWAQNSIPEIERHLQMIDNAWLIVKDMKKDRKYNNNTYR